MNDKVVEELCGNPNLDSNDELYAGIQTLIQTRKWSIDFYWLDETYLFF